MSGICGIINFDGAPVEPELIKRMAEAAAYRGPDGINYWVEGNVGLAHLALHTTPESIREKQPLVNQRGDLVLVADARVDNREELIRILTSKEYLQEKNPTDADLIMAAYSYWEQTCLEHIIGDFAFAIWDLRQQRLFCARDHFGVRPFYYHHRPGKTFAFASEVKALLVLPWVSQHINEARVMDYIINMANWDQVRTFYVDISGIPPAHMQTVSVDDNVLRPYWKLDPQNVAPLPAGRTYVDVFHELFKEAVRYRLRSANPLGFTLSGGLDSSSIVCMSRQLLNQKDDSQLHTFSITFDDVPESDERPYIQSVLDLGNLEKNFVSADGLDPFRSIESMMQHLDGPVFNPFLHFFWAIHSIAQQQDIRVILYGWGGDQVASHGIPYLTELARSGRWLTLLSESIQAAHRLDHPRWWYLWKHGIKPFIPRFIWRAQRVSRNLYLPTTARRDIKQLLAPDFVRRNQLYLEVKNAPSSNQEKFYRDLTQKKFYNDLTSSSGLYYTESINKIASAFGLEARLPFFDKQLVEFGLGVPAEQKLHQGYTRMILRRAMNGCLPSKVQWRDGKTYPIHHFHQKMRTSYQAILEDVIFTPSTCLDMYINPDALREVYAAWLVRPEKHTITLWKVANLVLWLQHTNRSS